MTARKPADPRLDPGLSAEPAVARSPRVPAGGAGLEEAERQEAEDQGADRAAHHVNVEMESGPTDREDRGDPLAEMP